MSIMGKGGTELIEVVDLGVGLLNLFKGGGRVAQDSPTANGVARKGTVEALVSAVAAAYKSSGLSNYDEASFAKLFGQLNVKEQSDWTKLFRELEQEERKALQLLIFLMDHDSEVETEVTPEIKDAKGVVTHPAKTTTRRRDGNIRLDFMRGVIQAMNDGGENGPANVAEMLRTNQLVGTESSFKRFKETRDKFMTTFNSYLVLYNQKLAKISEPVPVNLFMRFVNSLLIGGVEKAEPIFQGDGWFKNPLLRMLGIQIQRSKKCLKNS